MSLTKKIGLFVAASMALVSVTVVQAGGKKSNWTGNIGVYSQYVLRGITNTPEDNSAAIQGSVDWSQGDAGWYAGIWSSSLGYGDSTSDGFENDIYAGYKGKAGSFSWSFGFIQYAYINVDNADVLEVVGSLGVGPLTFGFQTLTDDVVWGNTGDTYWTLTYTREKIIKRWDFTAKLGYYTYEKSGKFITQSANAQDGGLRHLDLTFSHPIGNTGAKFHVTGIIGGGEDRNGVEQDGAVVLGVSYDFDI